MHGAISRSMCSLFIGRNLFILDLYTFIFVFWLITVDLQARSKPSSFTFNNTIIMDFDYELYNNLPRLGPGMDESTRRAYSTLHNLPEHPRILDIGCGTGSQTLELARICNCGSITAVDNHQPYLDELNQKALALGFQKTITTYNESMLDLPFGDEAFDVIWSEGAIYIMGLGEGLCAWKRMLKRNGYLVISDVAWFKKSPPQELRDFWDTEYPTMRTADESMSIIKECGYKLNSFFSLPDEGWWDNYYSPLEQNLDQFRKNTSHSPDMAAAIQAVEKEIYIFKKYSDWYGYMFYVLQKHA